MSDWLLHMTEAQRTYAVDLIDAVLDALCTFSDVRTTRSPNWSRLTIHGLADRRSAASVTLSRGSLLVRTPLSVRRGRFAAELVGPACTSPHAQVDDLVGVMIDTLAEWRSALNSPVTDATRSDVERMAAASIRLLRSAVHAYRANWEMATLQSSRKDGHVLRVYSREPDGRQRRQCFVSRPGTRSTGGMTRELAGELDRVVGDHVHAHVVELATYKRYRLSFDAAPVYCASPTSDPIMMLREFGALPPAARLMQPA